MIIGVKTNSFSFSCICTVRENIVLYDTGLGTSALENQKGYFLSHQTHSRTLRVYKDCIIRSVQGLCSFSIKWSWHFCLCVLSLVEAGGPTGWYLPSLQPSSRWCTVYIQQRRHDRPSSSSSVDYWNLLPLVVPIFTCWTLTPLIHFRVLFFPPVTAMNEGFFVTFMMYVSHLSHKIWILILIFRELHSNYTVS